MSIMLKVTRLKNNGAETRCQNWSRLDLVSCQGLSSIPSSGLAGFLWYGDWYFLGRNLGAIGCYFSCVEFSSRESRAKPHNRLSSKPKSRGNFFFCLSFPLARVRVTFREYSHGLVLNIFHFPTSSTTSSTTNLLIPHTHLSQLL